MVMIRLSLPQGSQPSPSQRALPPASGNRPGHGEELPTPLQAPSRHKTRQGRGTFFQTFGGLTLPSKRSGLALECGEHRRFRFFLRLARTEENTKAKAAMLAALQSQPEDLK